MNLILCFICGNARGLRYAIDLPQPMSSDLVAHMPESLSGLPKLSFSRILKVVIYTAVSPNLGDLCFLLLRAVAFGSPSGVPGRSVPHSVMECHRTFHECLCSW